MSLAQPNAPFARTTSSRPSGQRLIFVVVTALPPPIGWPLPSDGRDESWPGVAALPEAIAHRRVSSAIVNASAWPARTEDFTAETTFAALSLKQRSGPLARP
jgi:hypothetical protein